ncbi:hypothetical protein QL285_087654 [Trifolium repens]|nr:hypothetical protein QL285_087654 [Trifolium repens]
MLYNQDALMSLLNLTTSSTIRGEIRVSTQILAQFDRNAAIASVRRHININIFLTWKARNAVVFNQEGFVGEKVVEEVKVMMSWRILRNRSKDFSYSLVEWFRNPLECL